MKIQFNKDKKTKPNVISCKVCKMTFSTKESLEQHKKKARHYSGLIYMGKRDK